MSKTDWGMIARETTEKQHSSVVSEMKREKAKYLEVIKELQDQVDVLSAISSHKPQMLKYKAGAWDKENAATAVLVASDWHVEETVDPKTVNGLNEFNLEIADRRIKKFFENSLKLVNVQRHGCTIDDLILVLGGDFMSGYIHEELRETNELSPTETVLWVMDRLISGIKFLQREGGFKNITIPCVFGNHGRNTLKPRHATGAANSYEWMMYKIIAKQMESETTKFHVADGYHVYVETPSALLRIHHGDGLKYQGGIGGLTIPVEKAISAWNKAVTADIDIFGHWHQSQQNPKWICNNSLIGYNAYALSVVKAPFEKPSQTFFLLDNKRGRTGTFPIFVD